MDSVKRGDVIYSARHKGKLLVVIAGTRTLVCRKHRRDGSPSLQEVVVERAEVIGVKLRLPV